jgi:hypothetical protein
MPEISIEQSTFERLQRHANPLVDSVDSVINRGLDALERIGAPAPEGPIPKGSGIPGSERVIDLRALPSLRFTKVLDASIAGKRLENPKWKSLLNEMLRHGMRRLGDFDKLSQICPANMVRGQKEDDGYSYLPEINVSVQGQDANSACRAIVLLAQSLNIGIDIYFMWRQKDKADYPGERGRLTVRGHVE